MEKQYEQENSTTCLIFGGLFSPCGFVLGWRRADHYLTRKTFDSDGGEIAGRKNTPNRPPS